MRDEKRTQIIQVINDTAPIAIDTSAPYLAHPSLLTRVLDVFGPAVSRVTVAVLLVLLSGRECVICHQRETLSHITTPRIELQPRLLVLFLVGTIDAHPVRHLTDQLLHAIATHRATVVATDIAAVSLLELAFADQLMQVVQAAHPLVGTAILTGLSPHGRASHRDAPDRPRRNAYHRRLAMRNRRA